MVYNDFRTRYAILAPKEAHKAMKMVTYLIWFLDTEKFLKHIFSNR